MNIDSTSIETTMNIWDNWVCQIMITAMDTNNGANIDNKMVMKKLFIKLTIGAYGYIIWKK